MSRGERLPVVVMLTTGDGLEGRIPLVVDVKQESGGFEEDGDARRSGK